jgi:hypothetical protein
VSKLESLSHISLTSIYLLAELCEDLLRQGKSVRFRAPGRSMYPTIKEDEVITVEPVEAFSIKIGDIILYRQGMSMVAHRVVHIINTELPPPCSLDTEHQSNKTLHLSISTHHSFLLRDDTWGKQDVRVGGDQILGKVVSVERHGRSVDPYSRRARLRLLIHSVGSRFKSLF